MSRRGACRCTSMRAGVTVFLAAGSMGLLSLSSCVAQRSGSGTDWGLPRDYSARGAPAEAARPSGDIEYRPEVLSVGSRGIIFATSERPVPTRTITVESAPPPLPVTTPIKHVVAPGETLHAIARTRLGHESRWRDIVAANPGLESKQLQAGQTITIPR